MTVKPERPGSPGRSESEKQANETFRKERDKTTEKESELGPGSELDATPPDASRDPLPPDARIPGKK